MCAYLCAVGLAFCRRCCRVYSLALLAVCPLFVVSSSVRLLIYLQPSACYLCAVHSFRARLIEKGAYVQREPARGSPSDELGVEVPLATQSSS